ncbi:uncharacterized protein LOC130801679 isoform X2 [Amaranthus tricolor]|uniref:uncharacterized protein LOC130801679 isoform X2 n=1 Tax=Amaranthus tricolor TaxID=29722 RepID=UPI0025890DB9|nr:uncharacterized protein LOC130801679 isoform X2 [Amaranthus tricolor]
MPMDYDDNDISRHNLQLASEGRTRTSSASRPYDFPKFEFDDSLQGHLRFDSLVETEVFLGIQSQEDNQWIEDFSQSANGMEFNSTPADSCSISRRNNVWSEATSSESVEMLLKSVGQEEMIPGATTVQESDATKDQGHMEQLENPSAPHASKASTCRNSSNLDQNALCGNGGTSMNEGKHSHNIDCRSESIEISKISLEKTLNCGAGGDSLSFSSIPDNVKSTVSTVSTLEACHQVNSNVFHERGISDGHENHVSPMTALDDSVVLEGKENAASIPFCTARSSVSFLPESGRGCQEAKLDSVRESINVLVKGESEIKSSEDDKNTSFITSTHTLGHEHVLTTNNETDKSYDDCQGSIEAIAEHSVEFGNLSSGHCASTEQILDSSEQLSEKCGNDNTEVVSVGPLNSESISEVPLPSMEGNEVSNALGDSIGNANFSYSSDMTVIASVANVKCINSSEGTFDDTVVAKEESGANLLTLNMNGSIQVSQENIDKKEADFSENEKDICISKEADKNVSIDPQHRDFENIETPKIGQGIQSLEIGEGVEGNSDVHHSQLQISDIPESGNDDSPCVTISTSTSPDVHPVIAQRDSAAIGNSDDHKDDVTKKICDVNLGAKVDKASMVEDSMTDGTVSIPVSEMSQQHVEKTEHGCCITPSSVKDSSFLDHPQFDSVSNISNLKESADADLLNVQSLEKTMTNGEDESTQTTEIHKAFCGSPTIISSSEPSLTEKDNQDEGKGNQITNESEDSKRNDQMRDDNSFTFKVNALPETTDGEPEKKWSPFTDVKKGKVMEETAPSGKAKTQRKPSQKTPRQNARVSDGDAGTGTSKGTSERKGRRGSARGASKEDVKKGNQSKRPNQENASAEVDKVSKIMLSTPPQVQLVQMQSYGNIEASDKKSSGVSVPAVPTSNLPDLNSSALKTSTTLSTAFRQPFTDLQQVQLRAQIFVYGSLIQGTAPDEACMVSAFGPCDGGHKTWEPIWRVTVERVRNIKSSSTTAETPRSQSGTRVSDAGKQGSHSSNGLATPVSRVSSKDTTAASLSPIIPLSSPLWNISTPSRDSLASNAITAMHKGPVVDFQQAVTPMHPYQTPPIRNFVGHTSWPSQTNFPGSWLPSPQTSPFSSNFRFHPVTLTETVKLTLDKDTPVALNSTVKQTTASTALPSPALGGVSPHSASKLVPSSVQHSIDAKPRKRKKAPTSDLGQISLVSGAQKEAVIIPSVALLPTSPPNVAPPTSWTSGAILSKPADASRVSVDHPNKDIPDTVKAVACSEEILGKVAEAKSQAEEAADLATASVSHCEDLWSQLAKQKDSGFTSEAEAKLSSAAVAIAAAASVAKAAAAAAKIACNAAMQAKLMAEEAFLSSKTYGMASSSGKISINEHDPGNATPASILKSNSVTNQSSSILVAAKEAAKRRVEAASAASRQAENLDAIVKAAELAAAAVSQAGKIVAMGEPLPLNDLIEAGPEGYWKVSQPIAVVAKTVNDGKTAQSGPVNFEKAGDVLTGISAEDFVDKGAPRIVGVHDIHATDGPNGYSNDTSSPICISSKHGEGKDLKTVTDHEVFDTSKSGKVTPELDALQKTTNVKNKRADLLTHAEDHIKEGSLVEVFNPGSVRKAAWYTANILSLEEGKACVCYNDVPSQEGDGNLQEWIPLDAEGDKAPILRPAQPLSSLQQQQTRKRRRAALGDYAWCVGDKVDVWIDDSWWEGVVTEKNEKDETTLKVHIPAQGETSTVRTWNLRASRLWINGKWIEWSSRGQNSSEQGDTPQEKRQKLGKAPIGAKTKDKESNNLSSTVGEPEQSKPLTLSTTERTFDIGKTTNDDSKHAARRPLRTNQQKEGSRVVFGVPKPTGKKRKFMEVSKHFPANKSNKSSEVNDSIKFAKFLMPQGTASRGWKTGVPSRSDTKEKKVVESKPRVLNTRKAHRTLPQMETSRTRMGLNAGNTVEHGPDVEDSVIHDENTSERSINHGSNAFEEATEAPLSSLLSHTVSTSKKTSSNIKSDRLNRGRLGPSGGKLSKIEEDKAFSATTVNSTLDSSEPRRSNRRIQPTHRLLEGFQSSMVIPKMASVSHDKGRRNLPARGR